MTLQATLRHLVSPFILVLKWPRFYPIFKPRQIRAQTPFRALVRSLLCVETTPKILALSASMANFAGPAMARTPASDVPIVYTVEGAGLEAGQARAGFFDSSFDYRSGREPSQRQYCYHPLARPEAVCQAIAEAATAMQDAYRRGDHDTIDIHSCGLSAQGERLIQVSYTLRDDYGGHLPVTRQLAACPWLTP